jgi:hypothetical protein
VSYESQTSGSIESLQEAQAEKGGKCKRWKDEIKAALKELETWHKQGDECERRYLDDRDFDDDYEKRFNIYTSNVQIMQSALYNSIPQVEVSRTFKDEADDVARVAAIILQRVLQQDLDSPRTDFDPCMKNAIENRLIPGMGACWIRLETTTQEIDLPLETFPMELNAAMPQEPQRMEKVVDQQVRTEHVHYRDFLWSPCRTWEERRWIGRRVMMTKDKITARFGEDIGKMVPMEKTKNSNENDDGLKPEHMVFKQAEIFEIWDRENREVLWVCLGCDYLLDTRDDPLSLTDFDPAPKPIFANTTTSKLIPKPDLVLWQDQYNSLDLVNTRIDLLVSACKVAGVYDKGSEGIQRLLQGNENTLIPVDNWAMFAEKGGIKGQVDWLPLDIIVAALERLRQAREDLKQQVYELTGIADIVRGATKASETLGAQQLKAQFASVRIQSLQKAILDFGTEILRIKGEITTRHFTPEMLAKKGNVQNLEQADLQFVEPAIQLLKDWQNYQWRITIQPDSLAQTDYAKEKSERIEFLGAVSTYMEKAIMAVQGMPELLPLTLSLLKFGIAGFRVGKEIEGTIDNALKQISEAAKQKAQQPPPPDPAMIAAQTQAKATQMTTQAHVQATQAKTQADIQATQAKIAGDAQAARQKGMVEMGKARIDARTAAQKGNMELAKAHMDLAKKAVDIHAKAMDSAAKRKLAASRGAPGTKQ